MAILKNGGLKRLLCLALAAMVLPAYSCGQEPSGGNETDTTPVTDATTESVTELSDDVPKLDFGGAEFRTIDQKSIIYTLYSSELNGDVVNDAIFNRNREIEERFNIVITPTVQEEYNQISSLVSKSVMSGTNEYELAFGQMYKSAADAQNGVFLDWNTIPYVDFTKPWYVQSVNDASVNGKLYVIESDMSNGYFEQTWIMLYNKTKAEELGNIPDLYSLVDEGKWTLDTLNTLSADVYLDLNGDTVRDDTDFYGFAGTPGGCLLAAFMYGADAKIAGIEDTKVVQYINSEHSIQVLKQMSKLFYTNTGTIVKDNALSSVRKELFPKSVVLFEAMQVVDLIRENFDMRNMSDEFGVLPLPKFDADQTEYYTVVDGGASVMTIPASVENIELVGAVTEAMSALSYHDVVPAYSGVALEQKGVRDEDSIRMLRNVLDSRVIDFAYLYDGSSGWVMKLPAIIKNEESIVSSIESLMNSVESYYQKIVDFMYDN